MHSWSQRLFGFSLIGTLLFSAVTAWGQTQTPSQPPSQPKQTEGKRFFLSGTIASVSSGSVVVKTRDGRSVTVHVSPATRVLASKQAALADIQSGDMVRVRAAKATDGTLTARSVEAAPSTVSMSGPGNSGGVWQDGSDRVMIGGSVTAAPTNGTLSIAVPGGQPVSVAVPSGARVSRLTSMPAGSLASGTRIVVRGTPNTDGSITATSILVGGRRGQ
jgi:hypothetical protein